MSEAIDIIVKRQALAELDDLVVKLEKADMQLIEATEHALEFSNAFRKVKLPSDFTRTMDAAAQASTRLNNQIQNTAKAEERVATTKRKLNRLTLSERVNKQKLTAQLKLEYRANTDLFGAYSKLSARFLILQKRYQDLLAKKAQNVKLTKAEAAEFRKLSRQVPRMDKALKSIDRTVGRNQRNVGNYSKVWAGLGGVMRQVLVAFGAYSALEIGRSIFNQVKEIDGLNKALLQVTESQERFNSEQRFLIELSDEAGVELNTLQSSYTKFLASSKTTNLSIEDTRNIFRQTAKAGAVLGLSTDDINGSFRALEQILSKGKVQAEEIRGQLGERLPGAFQILAKSMGLTTAELSKQLELGNVISEEVLPGFAKELEKVYGLDTINKVDNLAAAQNRLSNEWNLFIRSIEGSEGVLSNLFKTVINEISETIKWWRRLNNEIGAFEAGAYESELKEIRSQSRITGEAEEEIAKRRKAARLETLSDLEKQLELEKKKLETVKEENKVSVSSVLLGIDSKEIRQQREVVKQLEKKVAITKGQIAALSELTLEQEKSNTAQQNANKTTKKTEEALKGSVGYYRALIAELKKQRDNTATTAEAYNSYNSQIRAAEKAIENLTESLRELHAAQEDADRSAQLSLIPNTLSPNSRSNDNVGEIEGSDPASSFIDTLRQGQEMFESLTTASRLFADNAIADIDRQLQAMNLMYDERLANENLTEEQRSQIEQERRQKERQLLEERRKASKKAFILNQAQAASNIIVNTAEAISKALAQTGFFGGPAAAAVIGALGAAQLSAVLSAPVPEFKDGVENFSGGLAIVGDGGKHEPITDRAGKLLGISPDKPTLVNLPKGSNVYSSVENKDFINKVIGMDMANGTRSLNQAAQAQSAGIEQAIKNMLSKVQNPVIHNHQKGIDYSRLAKELSKINKLESI